MFGAEFFVLIGFVVFLCLLGYVGAYRMLLGALDKRGKDIDDATAMQQKADAAAAAHQKALADARARAQGLAQAARDQLAAEADAKRKVVDAELAAKFAEAERQIEATRQQAMANVGVIAREASAAIVERLIGRAAKPEAIAAAVDSQKAG